VSLEHGLGTSRTCRGVGAKSPTPYPRGLAGLRYLLSEEVDPDPFVELDDLLVGFEAPAALVEALVDVADELFESSDVASFFVEVVSFSPDDLVSSDDASGAPFFA
jgi:hypothetical protein